MPAIDACAKDEFAIQVGLENRAPTTTGDE
jgi:hypothetical protein